MGLHPKPLINTPFFRLKYIKRDKYNLLLLAILNPFPCARRIMLEYRRRVSLCRFNEEQDISIVPCRPSEETPKRTWSV